MGEETDDIEHNRVDVNGAASGEVYRALMNEQGIIRTAVSTAKSGADEPECSDQSPVLPSRAIDLRYYGAAVMLSLAIWAALFFFS